MLKNIFENEYVQYMIVGSAVFATVALLSFFAPVMMLLGVAITLFSVMSLAIGYIIVDSYKMWREDNDKNKSRKKASSSKNASQDEGFY